MTRRVALAALAVWLLVGCRRDRGAPPGPRPGAGPGAGPEPVRVRYGDDPSQHADLYLPPGAGSGRLPVAVVIHGGFWRASYGSELGTALATDLAAHGWAAWNLEYRRLGNGGGWPNTFADVAAGIDALATSGRDAAGGRLDLARVAAVGHSAGGHLAVWAAARPGLPASAPGAGPRVRLRGAVAQAGIVDLAHAAEFHIGGGAVMDLLGGVPVDRPDRYFLASPVSRLPLPVPVTLVHGEADRTVPIEQGERFAQAAAVVGSPVRLTRLPGVGHFELIDAGHAAWATCRAELDAYR